VSEEHNCPIRDNDGLLDGLGCMLTWFHNTFIASNHYPPQTSPEREIKTNPLRTKLGIPKQCNIPNPNIFYIFHSIINIIIITI